MVRISWQVAVGTVGTEEGLLKQLLRVVTITRTADEIAIDGALMEIDDLPKRARRVAGLFCNRCHANAVEQACYTARSPEEVIPKTLLAGERASQESKSVKTTQ